MTRCAMTAKGRGHLNGTRHEVWISCSRCGWQSRVYQHRISAILLGLPAWADHLGETA